jgi:DNA helicase-2/ATP-dependent DNA helicase PcrA
MVHGVEFYQRKEIKDVLGYLTLLNNPRDDVAFLRVVNTPVRGIGKSSLDKLAAYARERGLPLLDAARESGLIESIAKKTAISIARFVALFDRLSMLASRPVEEILGNVLAESGYSEMLSKSELPEDDERLANLQELLTAARQFDERTPGEGHLEEFLEEVCLVNETDDWEADDDRATLMTLHASKGLEFPVVFLIAVEQGLIPHERSNQHPDQLEEERRLLFVGMTRAEEELHLSWARYREFRGQRKMTIPSQFLLELPVDEFESEIIGTSAFPFPDEHADEFHVHDEPWQEQAWQRDDAAPVDSGTAAGALNVHLTTAAELAGDAQSGPVISPEAFSQGMLVRHPEYGLGTIIALSGSGMLRTATVRFPGESGPKKFVLRQSRLQPVRPA